MEAAAGRHFYNPNKHSATDSGPTHFYTMGVTGCDEPQRHVLEILLLRGLLELSAWLILNCFNCKSSDRLRT